MATYVPAKRGVEYIFYIGLTSQADTKLLQANPTIASGDFKVSIDGGAFANPSTLPAVTPAAGKAVKVTLSIAEMTGDNISFYASDAAGAEWCDQFVNIQTSARQVDDLAFPTTSGRPIDVAATGEVGLDFDNVKVASAPTTLTNITVPVVTTTTTATNLTNAASAGDFTTAMKTSLNAATPASVVGAVGSVTGNLGGNVLGTLTSAERLAIADAHLTRVMSSVSPQPAINVRCPLNAHRAAVNKVSVAATVMTVYKEDDSTTAWTAALTLNSAAVPITAVDPT